MTDATQGAPVKNGLRKGFLGRHAYHEQYSRVVSVEGRGTFFEQKEVAIFIYKIHKHPKKSLLNLAIKHHDIINLNLAQDYFSPISWNRQGWLNPSHGDTMFFFFLIKKKIKNKKL